MKRMFILIIGIPLLSLIGGVLILSVASLNPDEDVISAQAMSKTSWQQPKPQPIATEAQP